MMYLALIPLLAGLSNTLFTKMNKNTISAGSTDSDSIRNMYISTLPAPTIDTMESPKLIGRSTDKIA